MRSFAKTIGVIGGMGPYATVDFVQKILSYAQGDSEQDLPPILTMNDPRIPDRTAALRGDGVSPVPTLRRAVQTLQAAGATVLCMPCNTAHAFMSEILPYMEGGEMVDMIDMAVGFVERNFSSVRRVGILCTDGTRSSGVYEQRLRERDLVAVYPHADDQRLLMRALYGPRGIKNGHTEEARRDIETIASRLEKNGAEVIIMACTEIPLVLSKASVPLVDATDVLARAVLSRAIGA